MNAIKEFLLKNKKKFIQDSNLDDFDRIVCCIEETSDKKLYIKNLYQKFSNQLIENYEKKYKDLQNTFNLTNRKNLKKICEVNNKNLEMLKMIKEHNSLKMNHFEKLQSNLENTLKEMVEVFYPESNSEFDLNHSSVCEIFETNNSELDGKVKECISPAYFINYVNSKEILIFAEVLVYKFIENK